MADEQQQERTEQATPKRREEARKKGDVPRSRELTMTGVMLCGAGALTFLSGPASEALVRGFRSGFEVDRIDLADPHLIVSSLSVHAGEAFMAIAPLAIVLFVAVFLSATAIGGWSFSLNAARRSCPE